MITNEQRESFNEAARPLIRWLNDNCHPHHTIVVDPVGAELLEEQLTFKTTEYVKD